MTTMTRDRGATLPLVAILLPVLILMTAFAVDLGQQRSSRRTMQARADIIALDMARLLGGRTVQEILDGDEVYDPAMVAFAASATRNNIPIEQLDEPEWGTWTEASGFIGSTVPTSMPTAVRVTARETVDYRFQPGSGDVVRDAVAMRGALPDEPDDPTTTTTTPTTPTTPTTTPTPVPGVTKLAGFSIGSFGARIGAPEAGIFHETISPILGNPIGVDALSYQALSSATVDVVGVAAELGLVTTDEMLDTEVSVDDLMLATARVLRRSGDPDSLAAASVLDGMAATPETQSLPPISLRRIVTAQQGGEDAALASRVGVLAIVRAAAYLSQCDDPDDLSTCSGVNVPTLTTTLPLLSAGGSLRIIQGPAAAYGPVGTTARNSQVSATLAAVIGAQHVGDCVRNLTNLCLLQGLLVGTINAEVTIDATIRLADGRGTITDIICGDPLGLDVLTTTGQYDVDLDVVVEFGNGGSVGGLIGPEIGSLHLVGTTNLADVGETIMFDVPPDVLNETTKEAGLGTVGLSTLSFTTPDGTGVLDTLATIGIDQTVASVVNSFVNPTLVELDTNYLQPLADSLGINMVGADVTAQKIDCFETPYLVE